MEPTKITYDICRDYLKDQHDVCSALVAKIGGFHRSRNLAELASCSRHFDSACHSINEWRFLRQVEAFFKKNAIFAAKDECATAARDSFMESEAKCCITNIKLDYWYLNRDSLSPDVKFQLSRAQRYIRNVLGDFHKFMDEIPHLVKVTPGATATTPRRHSLPQLKLKMKLFATRSATPYLRALYRYYGFNSPKIMETTSNRVELVPKNWKTDRTIACEPEGNLPLQLAFDVYAKRRLRRFGIDLRDQSANQVAAKVASETNGNATVDFQAASDTIAFNTVAWLFPYDWFEFLCAVRSPDYRGAFGNGKYHKFSSMGNGSTFCIETLLFAAACYAVGSKDFLVYGDDVIIEREKYEEFTQLTRFLGFVINADKSFHDGPFRESCGLDAYHGVDVTPMYLRSIDKRKASLCHVVNTMGVLTFPGSELGKYLREFTLEHKLPLVPYQNSTLSGVWIHPNEARRRGLLRRRHGIDRFRSYVACNTKRSFVDSRGYYLWFLNKNSQVLFNGPWELSASVRHDETSSVPIFDHKYVRSWVTWRSQPRDAIPDHLYW